jgi:hypothetical protein
MAWVTVSREVTTHASLERLWVAATDPALTTLRDDRAELVSASGTPRATGSSYVTRAKTGVEPAFELVYEVIEAKPPTKYTALMTLNGKQAGTQGGVFATVDEKSVLTWTIEANVPRLFKRRYLKAVVPELESWLTQVALLAESIGDT